MASNNTLVAFCKGVSSFLGSTDLSDFTITCGGHKWPVHRLCLSLHSSVLAKACNGDFKEGQQKVYDFSEYPKENIAALVEYLYNFNYEVHGEGHGQRMCFHVSMAILADKASLPYDIAGLESLATVKFITIIKDTKHAAEVAEVAILAYGAETATSQICKVIAQLIVKQDKFAPGGEEGEVIETVVQSYPQLAIEIVKIMRFAAKGDYPRPAECAEKVYRCPQSTCGETMKAFIPTTNWHFTCPKCENKWTGKQWANYVVNL